MSAFSVTPVSNIPPPNAEEFPNFIQFQQDGENLGGPDADTLNFVGLKATRGVGENSNVVTVTAASPGLLTLASNPDPPFAIMTFDNVPANNIWSGGDAEVPSQNWEWSQDDLQLRFNATGIYQIISTNYIEADAGVWPNGATTYGSQIGDPFGTGSRGVQARFHDETNPEDTRARMDWTDQHIVYVTSEGELMACGLFASAEETTAGIQFARMRMTITRLGDL